MTRRIFSIGALVVAARAAGCDEQPAGPARTDSPENAGNLIVFVRTAKNNTDTATYTTGGSAQLQVNVYAISDTLVPLRFGTVPASGRLVFPGLTEGTYLVKPVVRQFTTAVGNQFTDTITVVAGATDSSAFFRFRPGARVSGQITAFRNTPNGPDTDRFQGVIVEFLRGAGTPAVFTVAATDTTDVAGNYEFIQTPGPAPFRIRFTVPTEAITDTAVAARRDSLRFGTTPTSPALSSTITFNGPATGLVPDQVTQNFQFTLLGRITGTAFRDVNRNGTQEAGEGVLAGDTVNVVLYNADKSRVIATTRVQSPTAANPAGLVYNFTSVQGGTYVLRFDAATSRFPASPALRTTSIEYTITVPNSNETVTQPIPIVLTEQTPTT